MKITINLNSIEELEQLLGSRSLDINTDLLEEMSLMKDELEEYKKELEEYKTYKEELTHCIKCGSELETIVGYFDTDNGDKTIKIKDTTITCTECGFIHSNNYELAE